MKSLSITFVLVIAHLPPSSPVLTVRRAETAFSAGQDFVPTVYQKIDVEKTYNVTYDTTNLGLLE